MRLAVASAARALLTLSCAVLALYQCRQLVLMYLSEPVSLSVEHPSLPDVQVPSVSICRWPSSTKRMFFRSSRSILKDAAPIWRFIRQCDPGCDITKRSADDKSETPSGERTVAIGSWRRWVNYRRLVCYTLTPNVTWGQVVPHYHRVQTSRDSLYIRLNNSDRTGMLATVKVHIHPRSRPMVHDSLGFSRLKLDSVLLLETDQRILIRTASHVGHRETLWRAPCNTTAGYSYEACAMDCYYRLTVQFKGCAPPEVRQEYPDLPECIFQQTVATENFSRLLNDCECAPSCTDHRYTVSFTDKSQYRIGSQFSEIKLMMSPTPEAVSWERLSYPAISLISEMGGFVSLLLGVSVLSMAELAGKMVVWSRARTHARRRAQETPELKEPQPSGQRRNKITIYLGSPGATKKPTDVSPEVVPYKPQPITSQ